VSIKKITANLNHDAVTFTKFAEMCEMKWLCDQLELTSEESSNHNRDILWSRKVLPWGKSGY